MPILTSTVAERLVAQSTQDGPCLRWTGVHNPGGYGTMTVAGRSSRLVHRLAHEEWIGPIPAGLQVDHVWARGCRFRDCIDPAHLEAVTCRENQIRRGQAKLTCPKGHPRTPENLGKLGGPRSNGRGGTRPCLPCRRETKNALRAKLKRETGHRGH